MRWLIHFVKKVLWLPFDMLAYVFGGIPPSYYEDVWYERERDSDRFNKNNAECHRKYGMSMLEKILCAVEHGVAILYYSDIKPILDYIDKTYGKKYLKQFKTK